MSQPSDETQATTVRARSRESYQTAGRIGGLRRAALSPDNRAHTQPARDKRWQRYLDQVPAKVAVPKGSTLEAERIRRAEQLRRADMISLANRASEARKRVAAERRKAEQAEAELAVLDDAG